MGRTLSSGAVLPCPPFHPPTALRLPNSKPSPLPFRRGVFPLPIGFPGEKVSYPAAWVSEVPAWVSYFRRWVSIPRRWVSIPSRWVSIPNEMGWHPARKGIPTQPLGIHTGAKGIDPEPPGMDTGALGSVPPAGGIHPQRRGITAPAAGSGEHPGDTACALWKGIPRWRTGARCW